MRSPGFEVPLVLTVAVLLIGLLSQTRPIRRRFSPVPPEPLPVIEDQRSRLEFRSRHSDNTAIGSGPRSSGHPACAGADRVVVRLQGARITFPDLDEDGDPPQTIATIRETIARFRKQQGRLPFSLGELTVAFPDRPNGYLDLRGEPRDRSGRPFAYEVTADATDYELRPVGPDVGQAPCFKLHIPAMNGPRAYFDQ